jgi:translation elongation factor EF-1alpha
MDCGTAHVSCRFEKLLSRIDRRTGQEVEKVRRCQEFIHITFSLSFVFPY